MSHQRYSSIDPVKEPHSVSLKVLRLSRPSLVTQHPLTTPGSTEPLPASLSYKTSPDAAPTNPNPFLLTPILNLPPSFGSAYVGETFSCTLCANHEPPADDNDALSGTASPSGGAAPPQSRKPKKKFVRDVRIEAEMKTPGAAESQKLQLIGSNSSGGGGGGGGDQADTPEGAEEVPPKEEGLEKQVMEGGTDLDPGGTLQRIVNFDLKEEGNHVLAVTVSYYEATETSGRARTFRKLYQFICKGSLIVRTKIGAVPAQLPPAKPKEEEEARRGDGDAGKAGKAETAPTVAPHKRRWVLEAQLENCSEDLMQLDRVGLNLLPGLAYRDANWVVGGSAKPVLHPGEVEQVCFVIEEQGEPAAAEGADGRVPFGVLGIGWRTEMGNRGFLSTGELGARVAAK